MKESQVLNNIITCLKTFRWKVIRFNSGASMMGDRYVKFYRLTWRAAYNDSKGLPDLLAIKDGRHVWIEAKRDGTHKQSDAQKTFEKEIKESGAEYYLVSSGVEIVTILGEIK
jgi:predicted GH43/DUF377 family glycosyl hydrolase